MIVTTLVLGVEVIVEDAREWIDNPLPDYHTSATTDEKIGDMKKSLYNDMLRRGLILRTDDGMRNEAMYRGTLSGITVATAPSNTINPARIKLPASLCNLAIIKPPPGRGTSKSILDIELSKKGVRLASETHEDLFGIWTEVRTVNDVVIATTAALMVRMSAIGIMAPILVSNTSQIGVDSVPPFDDVCISDTSYLVRDGGLFNPRKWLGTNVCNALVYNRGEHEGPSYPYVFKMSVSYPMDVGNGTSVCLFVLPVISDVSMSDIIGGIKESARGSYGEIGPAIPRLHDTMLARQQRRNYGRIRKGKHHG